MYQPEPGQPGDRGGAGGGGSGLGRLAAAAADNLIASPIAAGGLLNLPKRNAQLALDATTVIGALVVSAFAWRETGDLRELPSPVTAGGRLYFLGRDGNCEVVRTGTEFETIAVNQLDDKFDASPAVVGDELFLRGHKYLYCIAEPSGRSSTQLPDPIDQRTEHQAVELHCALPYIAARSPKTLTGQAVMQQVGIKVAAVLTAGMILALTPACSFSRSSRSSASSSRSSSRGSAPVAASQAGFEEEIAAIAVLYVGSNGRADDFQREISVAAKRNGIPYWELDERIFFAIGTGLKRAGVSQTAVSTLPFLQGVRNATHFNAIQKAYAAR